MIVPRLLLLTDRHLAEARGRDLVDTTDRAIGAGAPAVVLREKDLPRPERRELALALLDVTRSCGAALLIASDADLAVQLGAAGVHLAAGDAAGSGAPLLTGRSCHTAGEVGAAARAGHDYVTVSPVAPSPSKPGYGPVLGHDGLAQVVAAGGGPPVLALGGVTPDNAAGWIDAGAHGVAVMGAVMGAEDPAVAVRSFLDALPEATS